MPACRRHYPGRFNGACSLVYLHCQRPSLCNSQVGSCNCFFGACSAFTHVMACTLAESPSDPLHRSSDSFVASAADSIASGWSEPVPGRELHPLKSSAFHGALFRQQPEARSHTVKPATCRGVSTWKFLVPIASIKDPKHQHDYHKDHPAGFRTQQAPG